MLSSNIFRLSAIFAAAAVQVTAVQFNVTVGGSAGLVYTPEFVVSNIKRSDQALAQRTFAERTTRRHCGLHLPAEEPHRHTVYFCQPLPAYR
jgi:hypothetical protein